MSASQGPTLETLWEITTLGDSRVEMETHSYGFRDRFTEVTKRKYSDMGHSGPTH